MKYRLTHKALNQHFKLSFELGTHCNMPQRKALVQCTIEGVALSASLKIKDAFIFPE